MIKFRPPRLLGAADDALLLINVNHTFYEYKSQKRRRSKDRILFVI